MDFEKDQFEEDEELSRLEEDDELGGETIIEEEEDVLAVEEEPAEEGEGEAGASGAQGRSQETRGEGGRKDRGQKASEKSGSQKEGQSQGQTEKGGEEAREESGQKAPAVSIKNERRKRPLEGTGGPFSFLAFGVCHFLMPSAGGMSAGREMGRSKRGQNCGRKRRACRRRQVPIGLSDRLCCVPWSRYGGCAGERRRT